MVRIPGVNPGLKRFKACTDALTALNRRVHANTQPASTPVMPIAVDMAAAMDLPACLRAGRVTPLPGVACASVVECVCRVNVYNLRVPCIVGSGYPVELLSVRWWGFAPSLSLCLC